MRTKWIIPGVFLLGVSALLGTAVGAQELFVSTEPASNMPAHSMSAKIMGRFMQESADGQWGQRYVPEVMLGLNSRWMLHGALSVSDLYSRRLRLESGWVYAKYRFYSQDEVHRHFRMAAFGEISRSRNGPVYDELGPEDDRSALQAGMIVTRLINKLAVSSTVGYLYTMAQRPEAHAQGPAYEGYQYSLSAGYLLLPRQYTGFGQTNVNVYGELIGQRATDKNRYFTDFAPALQIIFNSNLKLSLGYRFQVAGNMFRMANHGFLVSVERTFLNALKK